MRHEQHQRLAEILERHAQELLGVVDSVQIIATVQNVERDNESAMLTFGAGSWHARYGAVREVLLRWDEYCRRVD